MAEQTNEDWQARWREGRTGWHIDTPHPLLVEYPPDLGTVLVPLCGATRDLAWLAEQGHQVVGIELAADACERVFREWGREPRRTDVGGWREYEADGVRLLCGDLFAIPGAAVEGATAIWDRAAMVALGAGLRQRYVQWLRAAASGAQLRLVTFEFDDPEVDGPPWTVSRSEVEGAYPGAQVLFEDRMEPGSEGRAPLGVPSTRRLYGGVVP